MKSLAWLGGMVAALGLVGGTATASAADLTPALVVQPAPATDDFLPLFVKLGFTYVWNSSNSHIWAQSPTAMARGNFASFPAGIDTSIGDVATLGVEGGWYVTRNLSLDISSGIPMYVKVKSKGYNPANPAVPNGTVLGEIMPAYIPITAVYHFTNFGAFQPYLGAGFAPGFSLGSRNGFLTGIRVGNSFGVVLQGGADYMLTRNFGLSLDVKKTFSYVETTTSGMTIPGVGWVPATTNQHTRFQPWAISAGIVYKFGSGGPKF